MNFIHYTSLENLMKIRKDKVIKLTASNLVKPIGLQLSNGNLVDITDSIKPVVWLTSDSSFKTAMNNGLTMNKTEVAIVIPGGVIMNIMKWDKWAVRNGINKEWFDCLKSTAPNWETFYVSESPIPFSSATEVRLRPDVVKDLFGRQNK